MTEGRRITAVIGDPVEHSRSPQMFAAAFAAAGIDGTMMRIHADAAGFATAVAGLRAMEALGASITVPHKVAAAALCDELSDDARAIGAVNCLAFADRTIGYNTDAPGFTASLSAAGCTPRCVVILGGGGSARAVAHALRDAAVSVIARDPDRVAWTRARAWTSSELRDAFARADLVVDTTPIGLGEVASQIAFVDALPLDALAPSATVATLVYHRRTNLLERAAARGHSTVDGRAMLVHQGALAFTIWTKKVAPLDEMARALDASLGT